MAISKILYMKDCGSSYHGKHLKVALDYIMAKEKTQDGRLVGSVNCSPEFAFKQMKATKKKYGKLDLRQGYHIMLAFEEQDVIADTIFELTQRFVEEYLGKEYEAVFAVHDNTSHMHSHIVFNSVNFRTGRKYRYEKGDWEKYIQPITNRLCEEYGFSTIELESDKLKVDDTHKQWDEYKNGPFVWSDMIRRDLDACIVQADSFEEFEKLLREKGYQLQHGKHFAVKPQGMGRFRRCKTLGEDYTEERIRERIQVESISSYRVETLEEAERIVYANIPRGKRSNLTGLQKRYYAKLYRLGLLKQKPYSKAWQYREEIRQMHKLQEQYLFLLDHNIESVVQLQEEIEMLGQQKKEVLSERRKVSRHHKSSAELYRTADLMAELEPCERSYQSGDTFFETEHQEWLNCEQVLQEAGYSFEEVQELKVHFRGEAMKLTKQQKKLEKDIRTAKAIIKELAETEVSREQAEQRKQIKEKEQEKMWEKSQPKR